MSDLIDRQATINAFFMELCFNKDREYAIGYKGIEKIINGLPSAEKTGKWLKTGQSWVDPYIFRNFFCPICGFELDKHIRVAPNYCPNCGSRMGE